MGVITQLRDRLTNVMSGMGTTADRRVANFYNFLPLDGAQAEAGYRTSWLVRKIVDVPPLDMTRAWRDWQAKPADIEKVEAEEKRLQLKAKCQRALILSRLYGGSALILGTKDSDPSQPINPASVKAGGLTYVHVLSRWQLSHGEMRMDPADPWFGQPEYFEIASAQSNGVKLHPSRVVAFIGQKAPEGGFYPSQSWFWGDPIMQSIGEAVKNADLAQSGFSALIDRAATDVIKLKDLMSIVGTPEGETKIAQRLGAFSQGKSTWRAAVLDTEDEWAQLQVNWAGIPNVLDSFLLIVAGAADIPMTRLLGQSPRGLQSTGDGEERDYRSMIQARQDELLRPALDRVDELLIPSALGSSPSDIYYVFGPLQEENEKDAATIEGQFATALKARSDTGMFQEEVLAKAELNRMLESGRYPGLETAIAEADNEGIADPNDPANQDPNQLLTREQQVAAMEQRGQVSQADAIRLITDAAPRPLYVSRKLLNGAEFIAWAKAQGFETTVPADELHVTVLFSRTPIDWMKMGSAWSEDEKGRLRVPPGGARLVEKLGDKGAVVLLFSSSQLSWRHEEMVRNATSHDFDEYQPHVTITYQGGDLDLSKVEPFRGELLFGPEVFAEIVEDWQAGIEEE